MVSVVLGIFTIKCLDCGIARPRRKMKMFSIANVSLGMKLSMAVEAAPEVSFIVIMLSSYTY